MNFNVYLNDNLAHRVDDYIKAKGISRSKAISDALSVWLENNNQKWPTNFFDFASDSGFPNIEELRSDLNDISHDPLI